MKTCDQRGARYDGGRRSQCTPSQPRRSTDDLVEEAARDLISSRKA